MRCELDIPLPFDLVWDRLRDVNAVAACLPGATVQLVAAERAHGRITTRFRGTSVTYRGTVGVAETGPGTVLIAANAAQVRGTGSVDGTVRVRARAQGTTTHVDVVGRAVVSGRAAELPEDVVRQAVQRLVEDAAERFAAAASAPAPDDAAAAPLTPDAPTEPEAPTAASADDTTRHETATSEVAAPAAPALAAPALAAPALAAPAPEAEPDAPTTVAPPTTWLPVPVARTSAVVVPAARRARPRGRRTLWLAAAVATVAVVGAARAAGRSLDVHALGTAARRR